MIKILFFAWCRERLGVEQLEWPLDEATTVEALQKQLAARGGVWQQVFAETSLLAAVNQSLVAPTALIQPGDEVAFFPPVTGG